MRRVLFLIHQLPEDPWARRPLSALRAAAALRGAGSDVRLLAVSATRRKLAVFSFLRGLGVAPRLLPAKSEGRLRPEFHYTHLNVPCRVLDTGAARPGELDDACARALDAALDSELRTFAPSVVVTLGAGERTRERIVRRGAGVARFEDCPLPPCVPAEGTLASRDDALAVTFWRPSWSGGLALQARLAEQIGLLHPDQPVLVAGGSGEALIEAGRAAGFDLAEYPNLLLAEMARTPAEIWAATRVLAVPAVAAPPFIAVAEALRNGIPVVVSDRVDLPEFAGAGGITAPLPLDLTEETRTALPAASVEPWLDAVMALCDDDLRYADASARARAAGEAFAPEALAPRYLEWVAAHA